MTDHPYSYFVDYKGKTTSERRNDFIKAATTGKAYVQLDGSARNGTIGIADFTSVGNIVTRKEFNSIRKNGDTIGLCQYAVNKVVEAKNFDEYIESVNWYWTDFNLRMDDGSLIKPASFDGESRGFTWLTTYVGPTVKKFAKVPKAILEAKRAAFVPTFTDALGKIVEVGDFASISIGGQMTMGTVTEIVKTGKSIRVKGIMNNTENLITDKTKLIVIDGETKTRAMMMKLSK